MDKKKFFYKPIWWYAITELIIMILAVVIVLWVSPLTTKTPFQKYFVPSLLGDVIWLIASYLLRRYESLDSQVYGKASLKLLLVVAIVSGIYAAIILIQPASPYSQYLLLLATIVLFAVEYFFTFSYFSYRYAVQYEVPFSQNMERESAVLKFWSYLNEKEVAERKNKIVELRGKKTLDRLSPYLSLDRSSTCLISNYSLPDLAKMEVYRYDTFFVLDKLDASRGINKLLTILNEKMTDGGRVICCYKTQSAVKKTIYQKHSKFLAGTYYTLHFIVHRLLPKFFLTKRIYYDLTNGRRRILSKTEVLGRLVYCGFQIEKDVKVDHLRYVVARRVRQSEPLKAINYGAFIKLSRFGKNGKKIQVYKMRTMHPYSEYLQEYIYQTSHLREGGKFNHDIRVTSLGKMMRKYWLDELPMVFNLIRGDMKLIGVRPLSAHYFSLYRRSLQKQRVKHRPGLLPPFYADMPTTLEEIQASEKKYLDECEKKGTFVTDLKYLGLILNNILLKKARSA